MKKIIITSFLLVFVLSGCFICNEPEQEEVEELDDVVEEIEVVAGEVEDEAVELSRFDGNYWPEFDYIKGWHIMDYWYEAYDKWNYELYADPDPIYTAPRGGSQLASMKLVRFFKEEGEDFLSGYLGSMGEIEEESEWELDNGKVVFYSGYQEIDYDGPVVTAEYYEVLAFESTNVESLVFVASFLSSDEEAYEGWTVIRDSLDFSNL
jgi:hypothetical protein